MVRAHVSGVAAARLTGLNRCTVQPLSGAAAEHMPLSGATAEHMPPGTKNPAGRLIRRAECRRYGRAV